MKIKQGLKIFIFGVAALIIFGGGFYYGQVQAASIKGLNVTKNQELDFNLYWQVWGLMKGSYVDRESISDEDLFYGSIRGMVNSLGDPYSVYMTPKESQEFNNDLAGTFEGIGAEVGIRDNIITIVAPLDDMPAQKAGLMAGDKIYEINGEITTDFTVDKAVKKIRGPKGTDVTLTIFREGLKESKKITITRGTIVVQSVKGEFRKDGLYMLRISSFGDDTERLFNQEVEKITELKPRGIILDLRNNPGGYLQGAVTIASEWVDKGPIVIEKYDENNLENYLPEGVARLKNFPTIVLINGGSASAAEIVAGALKDHEKATLVGETSYGKGSVQNFIPLDNGSALKITIAKWLTPSGESIDKAGIKPNIESVMTFEDVEKNLDPQMDTAANLLLKKK